MTRFGYFLSSEEHDPREIVRQARLAEEAGFDSLWISDHFHPWLDAQGNSGFVWSMIGAPVGPRPDVHLADLRAFLDAGFDEVYVGQVGPDADGFFEFYSRHILPQLRDESA